MNTKLFLIALALFVFAWIGRSIATGDGSVSHRSISGRWSASRFLSAAKRLCSPAVGPPTADSLAADQPGADSGADLLAVRSPGAGSPPTDRLTAPTSPGASTKIRPSTYR